MRALIALLLVALTACASAFVPPVPASRISTHVKQQQAPTTVARLSAMDVADVLVAAAAEGEYEYGAVAAPGWVLPLGAIFTLGFAIAVPLFLRPGTEAFEEERDRLEEIRDSRRAGRGQEEE